MSTLSIRVTWPANTYHGKEWPPSPLRLYQALLSGCRSGRPTNPELDAALRHLEDLPPPTISAPPAAMESPAASAVPNNDGDITFGHWAKGHDQKARSSESKLKTIRIRHPWRFHWPVTYIWAANTDTALYRTKLAELCSTLTCLGHGVDSAWAHVVADEGKADDMIYAPASAGGQGLTIPYPGVFEVLEERYLAQRKRLQGGELRGIIEPSHRMQHYRCEDDPPARRWALFSLREPDGVRPFSAEGSQMLDIAAMTRHAIGEAGKRAGFDESTLSELMGHGGPDRVRVHPLPNVGHRYADGRIRRVLLVAPATVELRIWQALIYRMAGAELSPPGTSIPVSTLWNASSDDKLIDHFTRPSFEWTTATAIVLPVLDYRRGKPRPERTLRRLLRHAGISESLLESATFESAPTLNASMHARECRLPQHLRNLPMTHLSIRWTRPLAGPFALGAGAGYGFGVLAARNTRM